MQLVTLVFLFSAAFCFDEPQIELPYWRPYLSQKGVFGTIRQFPSESGLTTRPAAKRWYVGWQVRDSFFLGFGYGRSEQFDRMADVWEYSIPNNEFRWVTGDWYYDRVSPAARVGARGIFDRTWQPGGRDRGCGFEGPSGLSLFVFGGYGYTIEHDTSKYHYLNDLWEIKVDPSNMSSFGELAWWGGDPTSTDKVPGVSSATFEVGNTPCGRYEVSCFHNTGDFGYLFGGRWTGSNDRNDLWEFDSVNHMGWRLVKGNPDTCESKPVSSVAALADAGNYGISYVPGARAGCYTWAIQPPGEEGYHLFIYGGYNSKQAFYRNDLWEFNVSSSMWRCHSGDLNEPREGDYTLQGVYHATNFPGSRRLGGSTTLSTGELVMFAGNGFASMIEEELGYLNDVWIYSPLVNQWNWINGSNDIYDIGSFEGDLKLTGMVDFSMVTYNDTIYAFSGLEMTFYGIGYASAMWKFWFETECFGVLSVSPLACSMHGACVADDECVCLYEYEGLNCQTPKHFCGPYVYDDYEFVCSARGACESDDNCLCDPGYYGASCVEKISTAEFVIAFNGKAGLNIHYEVPVSYVDLDYECGLRIVNNETLGTGATCGWVLTNEGTETLDLNITLGTNHLVPTDGTGILTVRAITSGEIIGVKVTLIYQDPWAAFKARLRAIFVDYIALWILLIIVIIVCCVGIIVGIILCVYFSEAQVNARAQKVRNLKNLDLLMLEQEADMGKGFEKLTVNKKLFEIDFSELKLVEVIASGGSTAIVYQAEWKKGPTRKVAFKCFKTKDLSTQDHMDAFEKEVSVLSGIDHPNVLRFFGCTLNPPRIGIVSEFCAFGDLRTYMTNPDRDPLSLKDKLRILKEVAFAMSYLNDRNIIHRDLKLDNILLTDELIPKLIDFGLSRVVEGNMSMYLTKQAGTSAYMAPEVTLGAKYGNKCDVFSFAIVMFEVLTENFEPYGKNPEFNIELKVALNPDFRPRLNRADYPNLEWFCDLMAACWGHDPHDRPSFIEIVAECKRQVEDSLYLIAKENAIRRETDDRLRELERAAEAQEAGVIRRGGSHEKRNTMKFDLENYMNMK